MFLEELAGWIADSDALLGLIFACGVGTIAAITDLRSRTIPNAVTYPAIIIGVVFAIASGNATSAALGFGISGSCALVLYSVGSMGGGDVKLLAAIGLLLGYPLVLDLLFFAVVFGAAWAVFVLLMRGLVWSTLKELAQLIRSLMYRHVPKLAPAPEIHMPGGTVIAMATFWVVIPIMVSGIATA